MTTHEVTSLTFHNPYQKGFYGRKGTYKIFGDDVDLRDQFSDSQAIERFDQVWRDKLAKAVASADVVAPENALDKLPGHFRPYFERGDEHREFRVDGCTFIAQLKGKLVNQLWFIPSSSGDPRAIYVRFETVEAKERFERAARRIERDPDKVALRLLTDFAYAVLDTY